MARDREPLRSVGGLSAPDLSVVVALYNEASSLEELYRRAVASLEEFGRSFELIFVDDGSTDGTFAILEALHAADGRVRAVRLKRNFGTCCIRSQRRPGSPSKLSLKAWPPPSTPTGR